MAGDAVDPDRNGSGTALKRFNFAPQPPDSKEKTESARLSVSFVVQAHFFTARDFSACGRADVWGERTRPGTEWKD